MFGTMHRPLAPLVALAVLAAALPVSVGHAAPNGYPNVQGFADIGYASWDEREPLYRLYPGDILDVSVLSAPELNRTVTVAPDGRISMPLVPATMVADRSTSEVEAALSAAYASQLIRPQVSVAVNKASSLKVFVAGEVTNPGVYDMPGDIDALQAVVMAGGFKISAKREKVIIIRRSVGGQPMMRTADLRKAAFQAVTADAVPLRRFDIVYVPRTGIAKIGLFMQQYFREGLPIQFNYALNGNQFFTSR
jgi:protein involved in polysaccharide export with SLBB domain